MKFALSSKINPARQSPLSLSFKVGKAKRTKTKLTLTAGIHKDPWTKLPGVHVNAELERTELEVKHKKLPENSSVILGA